MQMSIDSLLQIFQYLSIILTGAFAGLGLIVGYKTPKGKVTVWGKVALFGVVLSMSASIATLSLKLNAQKTLAIQSDRDRVETEKQTQKILDNNLRLLQKKQRNYKGCAAQLIPIERN